ncbi:MAG TPA: BadF/BadG/BcrA/BcrD ATPase family protein, partial [Gemmataceae bacterium]|nr:BadF/BadG/BcrA/BcrD ATPase family protein [Gemmataceae bacterium]
MKIVGMDVGSTTVKTVIVENDGILWQDYQRHNTRQAEKVLEFLSRMETEHGLRPGRDVIFFTGSGSGFISPLVGGKFIQEVVAVAAAVERFHPEVRFVSEIGGEDMKTIFFSPCEVGQSKQVYMQSACSGGTGTFIEKTARKLGISPEGLAQMSYCGRPLHKISAKCGIFAEADANTLVKGGVPVEEIIASLFEAVVQQNLSTLTKGNTPAPEVLLLGGPNLFFQGLQQAWRHHLEAIWADRQVVLPDKDLNSLIRVPSDAVYYASLGCVEIGKTEGQGAIYQGSARLRWWIEQGQHELKAKEGGKGLISGDGDLDRFLTKYGDPERRHRRAAQAMDPQADWNRPRADEPALIGCDFGSTTAKAVVISPDAALRFKCYAPSKGNPIEDAKDLLRQIRQAGFLRIGALALTGYGKDLLNDILGADVAVVETVAHARGALHYFPDAEVICDVGGCDVKVMILRHGAVTDFRLNSQCSSGNGAFLQGVAERYGVPLESYAERAFQAKSLPMLAMGCGVFLQSDIVNQQRKGWSAEEIMASLAAVLPLNVWVYACQLQNLRAAGRNFVLQGGTHRNLAVVKAQVDFITSKVPDAEIMIHPYSGEAGAIGAALCALDGWRNGKPTRFRGFDAVEALSYRSTTSEDTVCRWCSCNCKRTFIDVELPGAKGRPWSKVPAQPGWERVITGNSCPKGLLEDVNEMRLVKARLEEAKRAHPNVAEMVRAEAFRQLKTQS